MSQLRCVVCVIGTRPEAIKMAPVVAALRATEWARCVVVATAQHRDLLDQMLSRLEVPVDHDLNLMTEGQVPTDLIARMLPALDRVLVKEHASIVLAQGDTTTVLAAALAAFHRRVPFGHIEAGLRTQNLGQPFPEEGYRQMVARIARWHFAPTSGAAEHLRAEGISDASIYITGNTGIDTLMHTVRKLGPAPARQGRAILLTAHRRENFGLPLRNILAAARELADRYSDIEILYPVHPNPNVQESARSVLANHPRIKLLPPQDYFDFVDLMRQSSLILTDSGGVQEEAPALAKPVLVLREQTERPEAIDAGVAKLVGTDTGRIVAAAMHLLDDASSYARMAKGTSPYGDGKAAARIISGLT
ncbi:non-hydrolyzing UDP-N-acetylglucosamine 2-epimerase [Dyella koreensis]